MQRLLFLFLFGAAARAEEDTALLQARDSDADSHQMQFLQTAGSEDEEGATLEALSSGSMKMRTLVDLLRLSQEGGKRDPPVKYCEDGSKGCGPPMNCHLNHPLPGPTSILAKKNGHSNPSLFCLTPYRDGAAECASGNLTGYGATVRVLQGNIGGDVVPDIDAQYCFMAGHCTNEHYRENTTLAESEKFCDDKFTHEGWAKVRLIDFMTNMMLAQPHLNFQEVLQRKFRLKINKGFAVNFEKLACIMGNHHCDVIYCKQEYCNDPTLKAKYQTLIPRDLYSRSMR